MLLHWLISYFLSSTHHIYMFTDSLLDIITYTPGTLWHGNEYLFLRYIIQ